MDMRSRSQRTSTLSRKVAGTACASRRCSQRTRARTPVRPGTVQGKSAPRPCSPCKVNLSYFGGMGVQLLQKPLRGDGNMGGCSGSHCSLRGRSPPSSPTLSEVPALPGVLLNWMDNLVLRVWDMNYACMSPFSYRSLLFKRKVS